MTFQHRVFNHWMQECDEKVIEEMTSSQPIWFGRVGGSDADAVRNTDPDRVDYHRSRVSELNGYFDKDDDPKNFADFLTMYAASCDQMDLAMVGGGAYIREILEGQNTEFLECFRVRDITSFCFIEATKFFLKSFKVWGEGKKILVVSPFSRSVEQQVKQMGKFFTTSLPQCEFVTYTAPITYSSGINSPEYLRYFDEVTAGLRNWHEVAAKMFAEIRELDFDVAWLSCGSYAMQLGPRIKNELGKKSIYVGSGVNLLFNIYGQRFQEHLPKVADPRYEIDPLENDIFLGETQKVHRGGISAYFGERSVARC